MKKILSIVALSVITFSASAQEKTTMKHHKDGIHSGKHQGHKQHSKEMMKGITLSDAQKAQMKASHEEFRSKMEALKKQDNITVGEMKTKRNALLKEQKLKTGNILTPDQKAQMAQNKANMQAQRKEMHEKRAKEMQVKLGLSDDQAAKLKVQNEATHAQMKAIKENGSLTSEDKKQQLKAIRDASKEQRKNLLTADQLKKLEEMKQSKKGKMQSKK
ncbi:MAG: hypothetical protein ABI741_08955 [Ferruginibacter sp.]